MKGEKQMINKTLKRGLFLPLVALLFVLNSCDLNDSSKPAPVVEPNVIEVIPYSHKNLPIEGTWSNEWGTYTFSNSVFNVGGYSEGNIVKIVNDSFNAGDKPDTEGDHGFFIVKFNGGAGINKYGVVRWKSLKTVENVTTLKYSEGSNYKDADNTGIYYNTLEEAEINMRDNRGFFKFYSTVTKN